MNAAVVRQFGKPLVIEEVQVPTPGAGQILVKIAATGVCHTDLHGPGGFLSQPSRRRPSSRRSEWSAAAERYRSMVCRQAISRLSIFDTVLNGVTVRGSIVGTRLDLQEALDFAGGGKVKATIETERLENINDIFSRMHKGDSQGRIVIDYEEQA